MQVATATRQAFSRALYPSALRRRFGTLREHVQRALNTLHQHQLQTLIHWTRQDIAQIDREMSALPYERLDNERDLLTLEQRLREVHAARPASPPTVTAQDAAAFGQAWVEGRTRFPFQPCTSEQLYRAYREWASHCTLRRGACTTQAFNVQLRAAFAEWLVDVEFEACITALMTDDVRVVRCWLPQQQLPQDLHDRRRYIDASIASFERTLRNADQH